MDTCLITLDETQSLSWTAEASDGRVYDAFALHRWMAVARCVILTCCITHVTCFSLAHSWGKAKGVAAAIHFFAMRLRWQFRRRREGRKRRVVAKTLLWSGESSAFHPFRRELKRASWRDQAYHGSHAEKHRQQVLKVYAYGVGETRNRFDSLHKERSLLHAAPAFFCKVGKLNALETRCRRQHSS